MAELCDLCRLPDLEPVYQPSGSGRGIMVHLCGHCGLVQSLPRADRAPRRAAAVSSDADWGNVRYGKGFRAEACLSILSRHADLTGRLNVLDVGSNRGAFARALLAAAPRTELVCIEPDERVAQSCAGLDRTQLIQARIEEAKLPEAAFDVIVSCHTIEHLASPKETLLAHWRALKPGGLLIVDAPNIALIGGDDILEEWFIDKHLYHFSHTTLAKTLTACGFRIEEGPDPDDRLNLLFAARKRGLAMRPRRNPAEVDFALSLLTSYVRTRARNLGAMTRVAAEIAGLPHKRIALWGAGRLFDALIKHGGFDPKILTLLIDTHLKDHVKERYGVPVSGPEALADADPQAIVVMSRSFVDEIGRIAAERAPNAQLLIYSDLLARARTRLAA